MPADPRIHDLLRRGWRPEDWRVGMLNDDGSRVLALRVEAPHIPSAWALDGTGGFVVENDVYALLGHQWSERCPDLSDRATFSLALDVLGARVGVVSIDARPLVWERYISAYDPPSSCWSLRTSGAQHPFRGPIAEEPDPVVVLAMMLAQTAEAQP